MYQYQQVSQQASTLLKYQEILFNQEMYGVQSKLLNEYGKDSFLGQEVIEVVDEAHYEMWTFFERAEEDLSSINSETQEDIQEAINDFLHKPNEIFHFSEMVTDIVNEQKEAIQDCYELSERVMTGSNEAWFELEEDINSLGIEIDLGILGTTMVGDEMVADDMTT
jgi:hypothetical protein